MKKENIKFVQLSIPIRIALVISWFLGVIYALYFMSALVRI